MKFNEPVMEIDRFLKLRKDEQVTFKFLGLDPNITSHHFVDGKFERCEAPEPCPRCITARNLLKTEEHRVIGQKLFAKKRYHFPVELLPNPYELETGPYVWDCGMVIYNALKQLLIHFEEYKFIEKDGIIPDLYFNYYLTMVREFPSYDKCSFKFRNTEFTVEKLNRDASMDVFCLSKDD